MASRIYPAKKNAEVHTDSVAYAKSLLPFKTYEGGPVPQHIADLFRKHDLVERTVKMTGENMRNAFGVGEKLITKDGIVRPELLKNRDVRKEYVKEITDALVKDASAFLRQDGSVDEKTREHLLNHYAGFTEQNMLGYIDTKKDKFDYATFEKDFMNDHILKLYHRLSPIAYDHLDDSHIDDLVTYAEQTQKGKVLNRRHLQLSDTARLLTQLKQHKGLNKNSLQAARIEDYAILDTRLRSDASEPGDYKVA